MPLEPGRASRHACPGRNLCFTANGIAKKGLLVRHLVMPGFEEEGAEIVRFLAAELSRDTFVHVMESFTRTLM